MPGDTDRRSHPSDAGSYRDRDEHERSGRTRRHGSPTTGREAKEDNRRPQRRTQSRSRSRSQSPSRHRSHRHHKGTHRHRHRRRQLPHSARPLSKSDFDAFRPFFARYLDLHKNKYIEDMDEREVRGRWKSFVAKWNEGQLAAGWYDPEYFEEVLQMSWQEPQAKAPVASRPPVETGGPSRNAKSPTDSERYEESGRGEGQEDEDDDEDDGYGPRLPGQAPRESTQSSMRAGTSRHGPGIPSLQDLEVQRELAEEERLDGVAQIRWERKKDRDEQKARLEELLPRAEAGTRERQLEKRREVNEKMKAFREPSPGAAEVNENELMGGGDGVEEYKRAKVAAERKKTERELRREEIQRAKEAEREERLQKYRQREEGTIAVLKEIARQRYG